MALKRATKPNLERRMARTHAVERNEARRLANLRLIRTVVLGMIATAAAFYWIGQQWGLDPEVMIEYGTTTLLFVAVLAGFGILGAGVLLLLRRVIRGRERNDHL